MIYVYECHECKTRFEVEQSMYDNSHQHHNEATESDCTGAIVKVYSGLQFNKRQGRSEVIPTDDRGSRVTKHWDGSQDAYVIPESANIERLTE